MSRFIEISAWSKRQGHRRLRWLSKEIFHIIITFIIGVSVATLYHELILNKSIRQAIEKICVLAGKDEQECKNNIDTTLNVSEEEVDNNIVIRGTGENMP